MEKSISVRLWVKNHCLETCEIFRNGVKVLIIHSESKSNHKEIFSCPVLQEAKSKVHIMYGVILMIISIQSNQLIM